MRKLTNIFTIAFLLEKTLDQVEINSQFQLTIFNFRITSLRIGDPEGVELRQNSKAVGDPEGVELKQSLQPAGYRLLSFFVFPFNLEPVRILITTKKSCTFVQDFILSGWQDNLFMNKRPIHSTFTDNQFDVSPNDSPNSIKQRAFILFDRLCAIKI